MNICVVHPSACTESAKALAKALGGVAVNPYDIRGVNFLKYDAVFNYGFSGGILCKNILNTSTGVQNCISKITTLQLLKKARIPTLEFVTKRAAIPKHWGEVVVRSIDDGCKGEGITFVTKGNPIPNGVLFTRYFDHVQEYRIIVFKGVVVGRYRKDEDDTAHWQFQLMQRKGFEAVDEACIHASKVLNIDYVGFDVLENKNGQCVIIEANSGPMLTDESREAIIKHFKKVG